MSERFDSKAAMSQSQQGDRRPVSRALFYESFAGEFDRQMNRYDLEVRMEIVFEHLLPADISGKLLLDAGCGTGRFSQRACSKGAVVTSMDVGENLLKLVAEKCHSTCVIGSVLQMELDDNSFDFIVCSEVIEHTQNPFAAVRELYRVLKPGGILALTVPNRFWKWSCFLANALKLRPYEGLENWVGYFRLRRELREVGFQVEKYRGFHLFPFQIAWTHPLLRKLDALGAAFAPVYINIAASCRK